MINFFQVQVFFFITYKSRGGCYEDIPDCMYAGVVLALTACGSQRYFVVTEDYAVHIATSKPVVDPDADTITFEDENGDAVTLPRGDVKQMHSI